MDEIVNRRSIRTYNNKDVDDSTIIHLLEAARLAPSGSNTQPWNFIIVRSNVTKAKIASVDHNQTWMIQSPVHIVCVADIGVRIQNSIEMSLQEESPMEELKQIIRDTAIAAEHIILSAEDIGLSTCWTAWFKQNDIRPILGIPSDKYVVCVITAGYSDEAPRPRPRKDLESLLHFEKW
ncbi:MAG: nitroreductase family protein [Neobacillus sp.]|nr:nitroreductase family protein [Neobacillus sp.]